jgi:CRP-like cAMP-binding protein
VNPLIAKLERVAILTDDDHEAITAACRDVHRVPANKDIIREGDKPDHVHLVLDGWAARYKDLPGGTRQIIAYLIPGDFCDLHVTILSEMDHGIFALTPVDVAYIPRTAMIQLTLDRPSLTRALWWATLVDEAVLREWIVNLGRRDALERIAHLLCEMHFRMKNIGLVHDDRFDLPLTQDEIADTVGLTAVHTNRMLQTLRLDGLLTLHGRVLTILDIDRLRQLAGFNPNYLHATPVRQ